MSESSALVTSARHAADRVQRWRLVRVWRHYLVNRGPLMAGGMTYSSLFSVFAGVWVGFSVLGLFVSSSDDIWKALIDFIDAQVPGLLDTGSGGLVDVSQLDNSSTVLSWTGLVALCTLAFTAMGWMRAGQNGVRGMFGLIGKERGAIMSQLLNLAALGAVAILVLVSATASVLTANFGTLWNAITGLPASSMLSLIISHVGAGVISIGLDFAIIIMFIVVLAGVSVPRRFLLPGAIAGAIAISALKVVGSYLIGRATGNPLLASFAVLVGFMLWLNLISHTFLIAVAWIAVSSRDHQDRSSAAVGAAGDTRAHVTTDTTVDESKGPTHGTS